MTKQALDRLLPLDLVPGLDCYEIDRRLLCAARADGTSQRTLAFYLFDLEERGEAQLLGFKSATVYAMERLDMARRRANLLIQAGRVLRDLEDLDDAFLAGRISWSRVVSMLPVIEAGNAERWIELAMQMSCAELKKAVSRTRAKKKVSGESETGLPRPAFQYNAGMDLDRKDRLELAREFEMRKRGHLVNDDEMFDAFLEAHAEMMKREEPDAEKVAARREACVEEETPEWLRKEVLARDGYRCVACGQSGKLHVHHIIFREHGGRTCAPNLTGLCLACHGLVHSGLLRIEGQAPDALRFSDRHGHPLAPRAQESERLLNVIRTGGRTPATELPDSATIEWLQRHPRLDWSWVEGFRINPTATEYRAEDTREETPTFDTAYWIKQHPQLQWSLVDGLRILLDP